MNGFTSSLVAKLKTRPKAILIGRAGSAFLKMARSMRVKLSPIRMAMKQAKVVFQSPYDDALPTNTLESKKRMIKC